MGFLEWIVLGLFAGAIARLVIRGGEPGGIIVTMLLGFVGAVIGGYLGSRLFGRGLETFWSLQTWIVAIIGSLILVGIYRLSIGRLNARPEIQYTEDERALVDRVYHAVPVDGREYDLFCSYAHIDGRSVAKELHRELEALKLSVWFDEVTIRPGKSMALQMDQGLRKARAGVVVLTPVYLTGRFWTERELGVLLHKDTLIPVLHGVTFNDVKEYSGILQDLAGFTTERDTVAEIAAKIASAVRDDPALKAGGTG